MKCFQYDQCQSFYPEIIQWCTKQETFIGKNTALGNEAFWTNLEIDRNNNVDVKVRNQMVVSAVEA